VTTQRTGRGGPTVTAAPPRSPAEAPPGFTARIDLVRGRVTVVGGLHRGTAHLLHDAVSTLLHSARRLWIIDVSHLTVGDHDGLRAIGNAYRRAIRHDRRMTLLGASPALRAALARLRLDRHVVAGDDPSVPRPRESGESDAGLPGPVADGTGAQA
jgi:anti-anti-sigma regulatory factor